MWTLIAQFVQQFVRLFGNVAVSHFVAPSVFGIMQLVSLISQALYMFTDVGIGTAIVRHEKPDDVTFLRTAWTIQAMRGLMIASVGVALSYPLALFYASEGHSARELFPVFAASMATMVLNGFGSVSLYTRARQMAFGKLILLDMGTQLIGTLANIALAWYFKNVWALVMGNLLTAATRTMLSYLMLPGITHRFCWDKESRAQLMSFGRWVLLSTMLTFAAAQADRILLGKLIPLEQFGLYGIALQLATMPVDVITRIGAGILLPAYSRARKGGEIPQHIYDQVLLVTLSLGGCCMAIIAACGPAFFRVVYPEKYHDAGHLIPIVAGIAWVRILQNNAPLALLSLGKLKGFMASNVGKLVAFVVFVPTGYFLMRTNEPSLGGLIGALLGVLLAEFVKYAIITWDVMRNGQRPLARDLGMTLTLVFVSGLVWCALWLWRHDGPAAGVQEFVAIHTERWGWTRMHKHADRAPAVIEAILGGVLTLVCFALPLWRAWALIAPSVPIPFLKRFAPKAKAG
jgi:O-antigen/teichoic acid export membrane protein